MTTGLFPQSLVVSFPGVVEVKELKLTGFKSNYFIGKKRTNSNFKKIFFLNFKSKV
jgi:hypothetical protein